jgi:calcineurin-like phosphoesterase family protein
MNIWLSGDAHFFHKKLLEYIPTRPETYMELIIKNHNEIVQKEDLWICTGDLSAGLSKIENGKEKLKKILQFLNGKQKILIRGNHDYFSDDFYKECGFDLVVEFLQRKEDFFCHYALENNQWTNDIEKEYLRKFKNSGCKRLFHGHTHARNVEIQDGIERINTCLDANNYYPIAFKEYK